MSLTMMTKRILYVLLLVLLGLLSLLLGMRLQPDTAGAQAGSCESGYVQEFSGIIDDADGVATFPRSGYIVLSGPRYFYASPTYDDQTFVMSQTTTRVDLMAGQTVWYGIVGTGYTLDVLRCMIPPPPTPTLDPALPTVTPTINPYPFPATTPTLDPALPTPIPTVDPYPPPPPLPTLIPDQTLELLAPQGQAITETASGKAGLAIIASLLLWVGLRMLVWRMPWR